MLDMDPFEDLDKLIKTLDQSNGTNFSLLDFNQIIIKIELCKNLARNDYQMDSIRRAVRLLKIRFEEWRKSITLDGIADQFKATDPSQHSNSRVAKPGSTLLRKVSGTNDKVITANDRQFLRSLKIAIDEQEKNPGN